MGEIENIIYISSWQSLHIKVDRQMVGGSRCKILYVNCHILQEIFGVLVSTNFVTSSLLCSSAFMAMLT